MPQRRVVWFQVFIEVEDPSVTPQDIAVWVGEVLEEKMKTDPANMTLKKISQVRSADVGE